MLAEHSTIIDQIAGTQYGLVTSAQALKALGRGRKQRWVTERRLVVIQPGVYRIAGAPQTWHQSVMAAALAADGIVSHRSAAELWGLIQPAGYVDVVVKPPHQPRLTPPAILHRVTDLRPDLAVERAGMRLTDPVRTLVDLGLVLPHWSVRTALARGITTRLLGITEVQALRDALGRRGRNGTGVIQRVLDEHLLTGGLDESELETRFHRLARRHDLPVMTIQHEVWSAGRFIARVDAAYPDRKIAIEVDGFSAHSSPDAFQRDRTRQNRLVALGWTVLRFTWADVVRRSAMVAQAIRAAVAAAA
jgi:very-short-patch-repair endonuclease